MLPKNTRWPEEIVNSRWDTGLTSFLEGTVSCWESGFDWRKQEEHIKAFLNS